MSPEAIERQRDIDTFLQSTAKRSWLNRALVLDECDSTQDEAFRVACGEGGQPGILVTAIQQHKGRGRFGRVWNQRADLGLPVTFALDAAEHDPAFLPLRAACAVCRACERLIEVMPASDSIPEFRIKWPNDVVHSPDIHDRHALYRKLAGILIERRDNLLLLGIGINVRQGPADWPESLRASVTSLAQVAANPPHPVERPVRHDELLRRLIESLDHFLQADRREIRQEFRTRDVLTGSRQVFDSDNKKFAGKIVSVDPSEGIKLRLDSGETIELPAATSTLVH